MTFSKHRDIMKVLVSIPRPFMLRVFRGDLDDYRLAIEEFKAEKEAAELGIGTGDPDGLSTDANREIDIPRNIAKLRSMLAELLKKPEKEIKKGTTLLDLAEGNPEKELELLDAVELEFHNTHIHDLSAHAELTLEELAIVAAKAPAVQKVRAVIAMKLGLSIEYVDASANVKLLAGVKKYLKPASLEELE